MTAHYWLITAVVFVILEILPPPTHFFFLCLALGALGAAIAAAFTQTVWVPWVVFAAGSVALVPVLVPLAKFLFTPKEFPTNVDSMIGAKALVVEPIDPKAAGVVKVRGEEWRAMSNDARFEKDQWVEIEKVEGTQVLVRRLS